MIRINLIPYRAKIRQTQALEHLVVAGIAVTLTIAIMVGLHLWSNQDLTRLQSEQQALRAQNDILATKIGTLQNLDSLRKDVEEKLKIVDTLQTGRFHTFQTLEMIAKKIPSNVWISSLKDNSDSLVLAGYAESSIAVAQFMRRLETSPSFNQVQLQVDQESSIDNISVRKFTLVFHHLSISKQARNTASTLTTTQP